jgi:hypothetical protein
MAEKSHGSKKALRSILAALHIIWDTHTASPSLQVPLSPCLLRLNLSYNKLTNLKGLEVNHSDTILTLF